MSTVAGGDFDADSLRQQRDQHLARVKQCVGKDHKQLRRRLLQKIGKLNARLQQAADAAVPQKRRAAASAGADGTAVADTRVKRTRASPGASPATGQASLPVTQAAGQQQPPKQQQQHQQKKKKKANKRTRYLNQQIAAYAQRKELKKALAVFADARAKGIADAHTYTNTINAQIRCGQLAAAEQTFEELLHARGLGQPGVVPFTVMLKGYSGQGLVRESRALLRRMTEPPFAVSPNLRTANTFVRGCLRVGAVGDAEWALHRMLDAGLWAVEPDRSTYTAVVALMCQALRLWDAERLVELVASLPEPAPSVSGGAAEGAAAMGGGGSSGHLTIERLYIQVARAAVLCGNGDSTARALRAAAKALENSSHLKEKMERRRLTGGGRGGGGRSDSAQNRRKQKSADLFRRHQLREEEQTFRRVCAHAIRCGVPGVTPALINDAAGGDDVVVKPTSTLAQTAAATAAAAASGKPVPVTVPDLLPFFCRVFCWPPAATNTRSGGGGDAAAGTAGAVAASSGGGGGSSSRTGGSGGSDANDGRDDDRPFTDVASYARRLVAHLSESFGLGHWATTRARRQADARGSGGSTGARKSSNTGEHQHRPRKPQELERSAAAEAAAVLARVRRHVDGCLVPQAAQQQAKKKTRKKKPLQPAAGEGGDEPLPFQLDFDRIFSGAGAGAGGGLAAAAATTPSAVAAAGGSISDAGTGPASSPADDGDRLVDLARTPLKLEIGAGTGEWAIAQAAADHAPLATRGGAAAGAAAGAAGGGEATARWVTLELRHDRVYETFANAVFEGLDNLCVLRGDALRVVRDHFPSGRVDRVFVNHPEPPERTMALVVNNKLLSEQQQQQQQQQEKQQAKPQPSGAGGSAHVKLEEADSLVAENHMLNTEMFLQLRRVLDPAGTVCIVTDNSRYAHFLAEQLSHLRAPTGRGAKAGKGRRRRGAREGTRGGPHGAGGQGTDDAGRNAEAEKEEDGDDEEEEDGDEDQWAFHSLPAADSRFMQKHGVVNGRIEICKGVPSHEAGLAVESSSYFDRLWKQGGTSARYVLVLTRLPYKRFVAARRRKDKESGLPVPGAVGDDAVAAAGGGAGAGSGAATGATQARNKKQSKWRRRAAAAVPGSAADLLARGAMAAELPGSLASLGALEGDRDVEDAWSAFLNGTGGAAGAVAAAAAREAEELQKKTKGGQRAGEHGGGAAGRYNREELHDDDGSGDGGDRVVPDAEPRTAAELDPHFSDSDGSSGDGGDGGGYGAGDDWAALKQQSKKKKKPAFKEARRKPRGPQRDNVREFHREQKLRRQEREYQRSGGGGGGGGKRGGGRR